MLTLLYEIKKACHYKRVEFILMLTPIKSITLVAPLIFLLINRSFITKYKLFCSMLYFFTVSVSHNPSCISISISIS